MSHDTQPTTHDRADHLRDLPGLPYPDISDETTDVIARTIYHHRYARGRHGRVPVPWDSPLAVVRRLTCRRLVDHLAIHGMLNNATRARVHDRCPTGPHLNTILRDIQIARARRATAAALVQLARRVLAVFPPSEKELLEHDLGLELVDDLRTWPPGSCDPHDAGNGGLR